MLLAAFTTLVGLAASLPSSSHARAAQAARDLIVTKVPDYVRPYIVRAYTLDEYRVGSQVYRFPVTDPSSNYAFTLVSTAAPASTSLGVLPHVCFTVNIVTPTITALSLLVSFRHENDGDARRGA
jgi:hypothetical protein